ncbi:HAD family hydrolase [Marinifilum fragile]|jgi:haloacid dehalogenase superfamily, subfamily IA, variant 1 with third motif having Dx(3-4)D or Dx(3-4)E|uniref:HAD family hydrolase n=1 Tax=Marinifilum fragile TaxID=570161 RepID=UPI002AAC13E8|nr:HAD family hydrolase [Marinifilum fragile]
MIKGVIFDLDGTLANSIEDIADSMNQVLEENNFPTHNYATYKTFVGRGIRSLVEKSLPLENRDLKELEKNFDRMMKVYDENCIVKTCLYPGIADLLDALSEKGIKISVFSNKANELTQKVVKVLLANWKLEYVLGAGGDIPRKPDPKGAILISEKMGIEPSELMYIGDSGVDMATAQNSGMHAVGVLWGFREMEELLTNGAQTILENPMDLMTSFD